MKRLLHNPIALVIVLGVCIMPSLYAWYTIAAEWDPYNNTEAIKVGVANLDEGVDSPEAGHLESTSRVLSSPKISAPILPLSPAGRSPSRSWTTM